MLKKDEGVVLRTARSGETSLIVTFLARDTGKIRLMAKGGLGPKSRFRGLFETCNHLEVVFYFSGGRTLYYVKEAAALSPPYAVRDSLPHMAAGLAVAELLDQVCFSQSADTAVVDLAIAYARSGRGRDPLWFFLAFQTKLLMALGALPQLAECAFCGSPAAGGMYNPAEGESYCVRHAVEAQPALRLTGDVLAAFDACVGRSLEELGGWKVLPDVRKLLGKIVHWTYTYHVQGYSLPKSLSLF